MSIQRSKELYKVWLVLDCEVWLVPDHDGTALGYHQCTRTVIFENEPAVFDRYKRRTVHSFHSLKDSLNRGRESRFQPQESTRRISLLVAERVHLSPIQSWISEIVSAQKYISSSCGYSVDEGSRLGNTETSLNYVVVNLCGTPVDYGEGRQEMRILVGYFVCGFIRDPWLEVAVAGPVVRWFHIWKHRRGNRVENELKSREQLWAASRNIRLTDLIHAL